MAPSDDIAATSPVREKEPWFTFFVSCVKGTELLLKDELVELGFRKIRADRGGVRFVGSIFDACRVCMESRIAVRVFQPMAEFACPDETALYDQVVELPWESVLSRDHTLSVSAVSKDSTLTHTNYIAQKAKDAIVDRVRAREGDRPNVDRKSADVEIFLHLKKNEMRVYLDVAGRSLHARGYRQSMVEAPLKENIAAAIVRATKIQDAASLLDPMCGSGTLAIEADLMFRNVAPALLRDDRLGAERWRDQGRLSERVREHRELLKTKVRASETLIRASDVDPLAIEAAKSNARRAHAQIQFEVRDVCAMRNPKVDAVITNAPYGERLELPEELERHLGEMIRLRGSTRFHVVTAGPPNGWPPESRFLEFFNGPILCRLLSFEKL